MARRVSESPSSSLRERAEALKHAKDGTEDCDVCEALGAVMKGVESVPTSLPTSTSPSPSPSLSSTKLASPLPTSNGALPEPPGISELGQASWTLLHSIAAYYPRSASPAQRDSARALLDSFAVLFPCKWCARDLAAIMTAKPPRLGGRDEFSLWLCETHNDVNSQLGKPLFDCTRVMERWRKPGIDEDA